MGVSPSPLKSGGPSMLSSSSPSIKSTFSSPTHSNMGVAYSSQVILRNEHALQGHTPREVGGLGGMKRSSASYGIQQMLNDQVRGTLVRTNGEMIIRKYKTEQ